MPLSLEDLDTDSLLNILSYLHPMEILKLRSVSLRLQSITMEHHIRVLNLFNHSCRSYFNYSDHERANKFLRKFIVEIGIYLRTLIIFHGRYVYKINIQPFRLLALYCPNIQVLDLRSVYTTRDTMAFLSNNFRKLKNLKLGIAIYLRGVGLSKLHQLERLIIHDLAFQRVSFEFFRANY